MQYPAVTDECNPHGLCDDERRHRHSAVLCLVLRLRLRLFGAEQRRAIGRFEPVHQHSTDHCAVLCRRHTTTPPHHHHITSHHHHTNTDKTHHTRANSESLHPPNDC
jgi:hypothetical protein